MNELSEEHREAIELYEELKKALHQKAAPVKESAWQDFETMLEEEKLVHDKDYLVRWINAEGKASVPRIVSWDDEDQAFFAFDELRAWPIYATEVMEIPE